MTVARMVAYIVAGWVGGVWVTIGFNSAWHQSWTSAAASLAGSAGLFVALVVLLVRDVQTQRLARRRA